MINKNSIMEYLGGAFSILVTIIMIINMTAGIIGGVWLLFEGLYSAVLAGFLYSIFGHYVVALIMMINVIFAYPGTLLFEKRKYVLGSIFYLINQIITIGIVSFSVMYVFGMTVPLSEYANYVPVLLFAYSVSFAPWVFLAREDLKSGNQTAANLLSYGQFGFILGIILMLVTKQGAWVSSLFLIGLVVGTVLNAIPAIREMRTNKELNTYGQQ